MPWPSVSFTRSDRRLDALNLRLLLSPVAWPPALAWALEFQQVFQEVPGVIHVYVHRPHCDKHCDYGNRFGWPNTNRNCSDRLIKKITLTSTVPVSTFDPPGDSISTERRAHASRGQSFRPLVKMKRGSSCTDLVLYLARTTGTTVPPIPLSNSPFCAPPHN